MNDNKDSWKSRLREACLGVPIEVTQNEVIRLIREYLGQRQYEIKCRYCGKTYKIHNKRELNRKTCPECTEYRRKMKEQADEERSRRWAAFHKARMEKRLRQFATGLNTPAMDFRLLLDMMDEESSKKLRNMSYRDFLSTNYWKVLSRYVKSRNPSCSVCGSKENLNVHHKTYRNKGYEYLTWREDLIVLCSECHRKFHDKLVS